MPLPFLALLAVPAALSQPVPPVPQSACLVLVADGGGLEPGTLRTLRALVMGELRRRGLRPLEDPALEAVQAPDPALIARGGGTAFVLRVAGRLGSKVPLTLEEVRGDGTLGGSASLAAGTVEECDVVIPRLVESLLGQKTVAATARIDTVTSTEARAFQKRPGERFWTVGVPMALFPASGEGSHSGISLGYLYEADVFQVGAELMAATAGDNHVSSLHLQAAWLPSKGWITPYLGAGIGHMTAEEHKVGSSGLGFKLMAGVELFRHHGVRLQAGVDLYLPTFSVKGTRSTYTWQPGQPGEAWTQESVQGRSAYTVAHVKVAF